MSYENFEFFIILKVNDVVIFLLGLQEKSVKMSEY